MPTEAQIKANRLNARKSTGPKSPEGKAASSLNALKSGIDAWSHIIPAKTPPNSKPSPLHSCSTSTPPTRFSFRSSTP
jgi:hypothetical protein